MKKRTFITLTTSEAERLRLQKLAERFNHPSVADFIKTAIYKYERQNKDFIGKNISKIEKKLSLIIQNLQEQELDPKMQQVLDWANFTFAMMIRLQYCEEEETNYVDYPTEMLDIGEEPYKTYRFGFPENEMVEKVLSYLKEKHI